MLYNYKWIGIIENRMQIAAVLQYHVNLLQLSKISPVALQNQCKSLVYNANFKKACGAKPFPNLGVRLLI